MTNPHKYQSAPTSEELAIQELDAVAQRLFTEHEARPLQPIFYPDIPATAGGR